MLCIIIFYALNANDPAYVRRIEIFPRANILASGEDFHVRPVRTPGKMKNSKLLSIPPADCRGTFQRSRSRYSNSQKLHRAPFEVVSLNLENYLLSIILARSGIV